VNLLWAPPEDLARPARPGRARFGMTLEPFIGIQKVRWQECLVKSDPRVCEREVSMPQFKTFLQRAREFQLGRIQNLSIFMRFLALVLYLKEHIISTLI